MNLTISTTVDKVFRQRLELLRLFKPYSLLRDRELDLLAAIQKYYYIYRELPKDAIHSAVFNYDIMLKIREELGMSEAVLNNNKMQLRRRGFMTKHQLMDRYIVNLSNINDMQIEFFFILGADE